MVANIYVYCPSETIGPDRADLAEDLEAFSAMRWKTAAPELAS